MEPNSNSVAKAYQQGIFNQSIPATMFFVDDVKKEYARIKNMGVRFTMEPTDIGSGTIAVLDDTCGNLIQLFQAK